ncbi:MAG: hypothetical protein K9M98_08010 [Cephaloticoccus sp.]|nr:hypothetical protein [Cephaloticoccus sp.]MCF7760432.1 hypothetical protein [Cephaloticoccus sp.]
MTTSPTAVPVAIGSRRELFIDEALIANLKGGATRRMHHPQPREIALHHDQPWEGTGTGYHSIFHDGERYRMYYKGFDIMVTPGKIVSENIDHRFTCYAQSNDGVHWQKPDLGLHSHGGTRANNIVVTSEPIGALKIDAAHSAIFEDTNPSAEAAARYKGIFRVSEPRGLVVMKSADGINWTPMSATPVITDGAFDSQNLAFWDEARAQYRAYWRSFEKPNRPMTHNHPDGIRCIRTATSPDLIHWSPAENIRFLDDPPSEELYVNQIKPYHRAPHIMLGFPARYLERDWGASLRALPDMAHRELRSSAQMRYGTALSESLLMCSRDGVEFTRWAEGFLRPGPERSGTWNYGHQYLAWHVVQTASSLGPDASDELSLYAVENYWTGHKGGSSLRRYTLRLDGFVSVQAPMRGGECITRSITFAGSELRLNFATSAAGEIRVEIQDETGTAYPGCSLAECDPLFGDTVDRTVSWQGNPNVAALTGKPVRLRFVLRDADLFAYRFCHAE